MSKKVMIIGGGFYGLFLSCFLSQRGFKVVLVEKEDKLMSRASLINQARIHKGFHYCRSALTALRSNLSYERFVEDYGDAIKSDFNSYYAISKLNSRTTAKQFENYLFKLGIPYNIASDGFKDLFNSNLIEQLYQVEEKVFNSSVLLEIMLKKLEKTDVSIYKNTFISNVFKENNILMVESNNKSIEKLEFNFIFNCTYSGLNYFNKGNKLNLKHRVSEMALVKLPIELENKSITIMDGPFFSLMPFPSKGKGVYTLSHVDFTHHDTLSESEEYYNLYNNPERIKSSYKSNYKYMINDSIRFLPALKDLKYIDSIWEMKTTLSSSENNSSRPILFKEDETRNNFFSILGGKIDNVFELEKFLKKKLINEG